MKKAFILIAVLSIVILQLYCVNHMDLMTHMQGEHHNSCFGSSLATLDFNHDGHDDLVVGASEWKSIYPAPYTWPKGKVNFYYGGASFDSIPDFTLTGQYDFQYQYVKNIGDVNGDGFDDLYISGEEPVSAPDSIKYIRIWTGGANPSTEPNITIPYHWELNHDLRHVEHLGDVNGDGIDDIGVCISNSNRSENFYIVWGGSFAWQYIFTSCTHIESWVVGFNGIGDINNDGFDDFSIGFTNQNTEPDSHYVYLYFGNQSGTTNNIVILYNNSVIITPMSFPLGDVNGDGIADFMGYSPYDGLNVWLSPYINQAIPDAILFPGWQGGYGGRALNNGDLNNDGFDDVVGSSYFQQAFSVWLGRSNFNGTSDLIVYASSTHNPDIDYFGKELTMGDYNADGYCDVAVSAPQTDFSLAGDYRGYVYVYAGNIELEDTTVANDDETSPVTDTAQWEIKVYPNPMPQGKIKLSIEFIGSGYKTAKSLSVILYNLKGQKIARYNISHSDLKTGVWTGKIKQLPRGTYLLSVNEKDNKLITKKAMMLK